MSKGYALSGFIRLRPVCGEADRLDLWQIGYAMPDRRHARRPASDYASRIHPLQREPPAGREEVKTIIRKVGREYRFSGKKKQTIERRREGD